MVSLKKVLVSSSVTVLLIGLCTGFAYAEASKSGVTTADLLNVRETPSASSNVLAKLSKGSQVSVLSGSDGWYKVSSGKVTGWISSQFVSFTDTVIASATVNSDSVNMRSNPELSAGIVTRLGKGVKVSVFSRSGDWYKVKTAEGTTGWIFKDFLFIRDGNVSRGDEERTEVKPVEANSAAGQEVVDYAKQFLGVRYVYGASSPSGFDCSGFTLYVFKHFGINLERVAADQAKGGTRIAKSELQPGDLVFYDTDGGHNYINHVGIYIGNGNFIHASSGSSAHKVVISNLSEGFYANAFMTAKRYLK